MSYLLDFHDKGFFVSMTSVITLDDIDRSNGDLHGHRDFDHHRFQLWDLSKADFSPISESDILEAAATDFVASKTRYMVKVGFIVLDDHVKTICSAYISQSLAMGSPWQFEIFDDPDVARKWAVA